MKEYFEKLDKYFLDVYKETKNNLFGKFIKAFSFNPKVTYIFLLIINFLYLNNKILFNIIFFLIFDICIFTLKRIIRRKRPMDFASSLVSKLSGLGPDAYSFPSAHTFSAFQIVPLSFVEFKFFGIIILAYAITVAFSRIYQRHHFFSDILGGMILGIIFGVINVLFI